MPPLSMALPGRSVALPGRSAARSLHTCACTHIHEPSTASLSSDLRFGKVVNIGSNLVYNPVVTYYDYTAAKAALVALTRNLAAELGPSPMSKRL